MPGFRSSSKGSVGVVSRSGHPTYARRCSRPPMPAWARPPGGGHRRRPRQRHQLLPTCSGAGSSPTTVTPMIMDRRNRRLGRGSRPVPWIDEVKRGPRKEADGPASSGTHGASGPPYGPCWKHVSAKPGRAEEKDRQDGRSGIRVAGQPVRAGLDPGRGAHRVNPSPLGEKAWRPGGSLSGRGAGMRGFQFPYPPDSSFPLGPAEGFSPRGEGTKGSDIMGYEGLISEQVAGG